MCPVHHRRSKKRTLDLEHREAKINRREIEVIVKKSGGMFLAIVWT